MKYRGLQRSGIIYAVLVDIYGQYGKFQDAEECLAALKSEGVQPSASMFCALANAYAQQVCYFLSCWTVLIWTKYHVLDVCLVFTWSIFFSPIHDCFQSFIWSTVWWHLVMVMLFNLIDIVKLVEVHLDCRNSVTMSFMRLKEDNIFIADLWAFGLYLRSMFRWIFITDFWTFGLYLRSIIKSWVSLKHINWRILCFFFLVSINWRNNYDSP